MDDTRARVHKNVVNRGQRDRLRSPLEAKSEPVAGIRCPVLYAAALYLRFSFSPALEEIKKSSRWFGWQSKPAYRRELQSCYCAISSRRRRLVRGPAPPITRNTSSMVIAIYTNAPMVPYRRNKKAMVKLLKMTLKRLQE